MFPISVHQFKLQVEFSDRSEPLFDAPPIKPPVSTLWTLPNKPPVEPKPRAKPPDANVAFEPELWTIPFAIAIERKPPEFTLWTFPSTSRPSHEPSRPTMPQSRCPLLSPPTPIAA